MTTTKQYDALNRLTSIVSLPQTPDAIPQTLSFAYDYNSANQRTRTTHADSSYWIYQYDTLGQVISGKHFWADGTPVAGQQFEYGFDDIGNRQTAAHGGNAGGSNLRVETYTANDLNQYTQRTVPGFAEVQGRARSDATVTVNLQPTTRQGLYWRSELMTDNSASPVWLGITNVAVLRGAGTGGTDLVASNTGTRFLPQTPETFTHDADGNLTRDGRWTNYWDGENRLIRTESLGLETFQNSQFAILNARIRQDWSHLPDGRWAQRVIYSWTDNDWLPQATNRFLWDGQVLLAVLNGSNQPEQTYLRGLDLSGTPQGAGGVGGLLAICNLKSSISNSPQSHFVCFDGNGNVTALVAADGSGLSAVYEYDPFGNTLRATGPAAQSNSLRFSTQFADDLSRRVKYLYRDYDAGMGRWMSRDPIGERGGLNLYGFVRNSPMMFFDPLGLDLGDILDPNTYANNPIYLWLYTGDPNTSPESFCEAIDPAAEYLSCWASCMKGANQIVVGIVAGGAGSLPYIRVPKDWLPKGITGGGVGNPALKDPNTSLLRTVCTSVKRACGTKNWLSQQLTRLANAAKRGTTIGVSAGLGVAGAALGEAALSTYCAVKCANQPSEQ